MSAIVTVKMTALQLGECVYKMSIVADEQDLQDSYSIDSATAQAWLAALYAAKPGAVAIPTAAVELLIGELENCCDIADDNISAGDPSYIAYRTSMRKAIANLKAAQQ